MAEDLIEKACKESNSISDYLILRENSKTIGKDTAEVQVLYKSPEQVTSSEMAFCNDLTKQFYIQADSRGWVECGSKDIEDSLAVAIESDSRYLIVKTKDSAVSDPNSLQSFILFKFSSDWEDDEHESAEDQIQVPCLYLYQLHTRILSRGKGNGSCMLDILEDLARKYQFPKIKLTVLKGNEQAIQLYKRRGYNLDSTDPSNFDLPSDHELYNPMMTSESVPPKPLEVSIQDQEKAEEYKKQANDFYAKGNFEAAIQFYSNAISLNPTVAAFYSNRSIANFKLEFYGAALADASAAIEIDSRYVKGYYRRASANMALGRLKEAIKDFKAVTSVAPNDTSATSKLKSCQKELRRIEFEKAIFVDTTVKSALEMIGDINAITVEDTYSGPHLDDPDQISLSFVTDLLEWMKDKKKLHKKYTYRILAKIREYFISRPTIEDVVIPENSKITICGDIHGQYYDLLNIFEKNGLPSPQNMYLFNGDFVDRGSFSVECILALFAFKLLYPDSLYLSRGNHETDDMNRIYGFEGEVKHKYTDATFKLFSEIFNAIPLGNLIMNKILVIHGGLFSRDGVTIDDLRQIDRFKQPGNTGLMCELLWSDPQLLPGRGISQRGVGLRFGPDVTEEFCKTNDLMMIIRSHEVKQDGYEIAHNGKCVTIFSAPNYCDANGNKGAYIHITRDLSVSYVQFDAVPHPPPGAMKYAQMGMGLGGF